MFTLITHARLTMAVIIIPSIWEHIAVGERLSLIPVSDIATKIYVAMGVIDDSE